MTLLEILNKQHSLKGVVFFKQSSGGSIIAEVENDLATARLSLSGGHLLSWQPKAQAQPVVWLSESAKIAPGQSIRGGVPVCWPWFGPHESEESYPNHGFARTSSWQVIKTSMLSGGETEIELLLEQSKNDKTQWPYNTSLSLHITIGESLKMALTTRNDSEQAIAISEALHTYFQISDIGAVVVEGLDGCDYLDKVVNFDRRTQQGQIEFCGETDRVYIDTTADCVIVDQQLQRRIRVGKSGSLSTIVWAPWADKARQMGDLGADNGWRRMVCVESANAAANKISINPGKSHTLAVSYNVEPL